MWELPTKKLESAAVLLKSGNSKQLSLNVLTVKFRCYHPISELNNIMTYTTVTRDSVYIKYPKTKR